MNLAKELENFIITNHLFNKSDQLLVACSGGCDSVVLVHLLKQLLFKISIAHCNFQLRGAESDRDEAFVQNLAQELNIPFYVQKMDTKQYELEHKVNTQIAARELRYNWFATLQNANTNQPFTFILTAHHANDNIETVFMNFCKGTGINGMHGILPKNKNIIRPLLFAKRIDLENYAMQNAINFIQDSSNESSKYSRNFIRNEVVPLLQQKYPQIEDNINHNIEKFKEVEILYTEAIALKKKKIVAYKNNEIHIPIFKLVKEKAYRTVLYEIIRDYNFSSKQLIEVIKLMDAENSKYIHSTTHTIIKNRNWLIITPIVTEQSQHILIHQLDKKIVFENGMVVIENKIANLIEINNSIAQINPDKLEYPLVLRKWKDGDYFYPLGMMKKKKVSRFLIDLKLSKPEKDKVWILESNQKIIWVVGYRIDERYKVRDFSNENILFKLST
jgi:tRNA(Ile)-lysidine synthase